MSLIFVFRPVFVRGGLGDLPRFFQRNGGSRMFYLYQIAGVFNGRINLASRKMNLPALKG
jgi:hypothetical protein